MDNENSHTQLIRIKQHNLGGNWYKVLKMIIHITYDPAAPWENIHNCGPIAYFQKVNTIKMSNHSKRHEQNAIYSYNGTLQRTSNK